MNKNTLSNPVRSIAFFLTAVILACTFGFTVDGWQEIGGEASAENKEPEEDHPEDTENPGNQENFEQEEIPKEPEIYIPEYTSRLTGLEISEDRSKAGMLAFVMSSNLPAYGISSAEILCEIPIENGGTRMIAFISENENLWKIGSITNTRGYISNIAKYFGSTLISYGNDDSTSYQKCDLKDSILDFSANDGYHYTEYTSNVYTNRDLLISALANNRTESSDQHYSPLPFVHTKFGEELISFDALANKIKLTEGGAADELRYDAEIDGYSLYKNGSAIIDMLNGNTTLFTNCFILFANSVVYDNSNGNQMVMDTIGDGGGYYFTNGSFCEIRWTATVGGIMTFYTADGEKLCVNRGTNYISFLRSSQAEKINIQ